MNARLQDGQKLHLLCSKCEETLSAMEGKISRGLFKKIANYRGQSSAITITEPMRVGYLLNPLAYRHAAASTDCPFRTIMMAW